MSVFNRVRVTRPKRNKFDLSFENKLTLNFGEIVPVLCKEMYPGDSFKLSTEIFARTQPLVAPIMQKCDIFLHNYFIPSRLVYKSFPEFLVHDEVVDDPNAPQIPWTTYGALVQAYYTLGLGDGKGLPNRSLADYLNLPTNLLDDGGDPLDFSSDNTPISMMPFIAYNIIVLEYYTPQSIYDTNSFQDLRAKYQYIVDEGGYIDTATLVDLIKLQNCCYPSDYFTSALPWTQRGNPVAVGGNGDVFAYGTNTAAVGTAEIQGITMPDLGGSGVAPGDSFLTREFNFGHLDNPGITATTKGGLKTEFNIDVNDLRTAFQIQAWMEKNARGGTRYIEQILSHFGVRSKDARLQRPEFLSGVRQPIQISEVLQQSVPNATQETALGQMAGHAISSGYLSNKSYYATEHGFYISLAMVVPRAAYYQGLPKLFTKFDKYDFYWPEFANLGEEAIQSDELFFLGDGRTSAQPVTFGYTPRYSYLKTSQDEVHGDFRGDLDYWHAARKFVDSPELTQEFLSVSDSDDVNRIFAYKDTDSSHILLLLNHHLSAVRPMPYFGAPKIG